MTIADYAARPLPPNTNPEFAFSPKGRSEPYYHDGSLRYDLTPLGPPVPPMISNPRRLHEPTPIDDREKAWRNMIALSAKRKPIKQNGFVAPMGSLEGLDHFVARVEAIKRLTDQQERDRASRSVLIEQDKELPRIVDEFRANGFKAVSLTRAEYDDDDDDIADEPRNPPPAFGVKSTDEFGVHDYYDIEEAAPILRRIEWEREEAQHGPTIKVRLVIGEKIIGAIPTADWMAKFVNHSEVKAMGRKIAAAVEWTEVENNRARAEYYGAVGSALYGVRRGPSYPEQSLDDLGAEELTVPKAERSKPEYLRTAALKASGPQELGLHGSAEESKVIVKRRWQEAQFIVHPNLRPRTDTFMIGYREPMMTPAQATEPREQDLWPEDYLFG